MFDQLSKCLYCIWPVIVIGIAWFLSRGVGGKVFYGHGIQPGIDPLGPQGHEIFETRSKEDAEKRHIIYWAAGIIVIGYLCVLAFNTFTLRAAAAQPTITPTRPPSPTPTQILATPTFTPALPTQTIIPTQATGSPTYVPTATDRIVYLAGSQSTVVVTVLVPKQIQIIVTATFIPSPTSTRTATQTRIPSLTRTPTPSQTASPTSTPSSTWTATPTVTDTPTSTLEGDEP